MVELVTGLSAATVAANLAQIKNELTLARACGGHDVGSGGQPSTVLGGSTGSTGTGDSAGGDAGTREVEVLAATKYVATHDLPTLAAGGVTLVGENRAQSLQEKVSAHGELFEWDFIGQLQSRKVRAIVPHVRLIHSVASDSALTELERHAAAARPGLRILVEVNIAEDPDKAGIAPGDLDAFIARSPVPVAGLMTMPPLCTDPEGSRRWFAALRELARERNLEHLSMGTSQDYVVAAEEGATIVRIGTKLYDQGHASKSANY